MNKDLLVKLVTYWSILTIDILDGKSLLIERLKRQDGNTVIVFVSEDKFLKFSADFNFPTTPNPILVGLTEFLQRLATNVAARHETPSKGDPLRDLDLSKLGLCNRDTCGDFYKIIDEFRSSDLYTTLKTLLFLMQDNDGLKIILSSFKDPQNLKFLFSKDTPSKKRKLTEKLGERIDGFVEKVNIERSVDSKSNYIDYYDGIDSNSNISQTLNGYKVTTHPVIGSTRGPIDYYEYYYHNSRNG